MVDNILVVEDSTWDTHILAVVGSSLAEVEDNNIAVLVLRSATGTELVADLVELVHVDVELVHVELVELGVVVLEWDLEVSHDDVLLSSVALYSAKAACTGMSCVEGASAEKAPAVKTYEVKAFDVLIVEELALQEAPSWPATLSVGFALGDYPVEPFVVDLVEMVIHVDIVNRTDALGVVEEYSELLV